MKPRFIGGEPGGVQDPSHAMYDVADTSTVLLIAGVVGCTLAVAAGLLGAFPDLPALADAHPDALVQYMLTKKQAVRLHAAMALGRRAAIRVPPANTPIRTNLDALAWFQSRLQGLDHEELHALYLDRRLRPVHYRRISSGSDAATVVEPRQVLKPAVEMGASGLVIAHNHPSCDPEPSPEDRLLTHRLRVGADALGIRLIDHLIIAGNRWESLATRGEM